MLCSHPKSCQWCFHHLQYTRSANKYPITSSLNSRQLNLSPVFKKCQTVPYLLKTLLLPTFNLNEPVQMHCSSSRERRMHLYETRGECLMLKHTLCILNEILLQGSLSSHWRVSTCLQPFPFTYGQMLFVHLYLHSVLYGNAIYHTCIITQLGLFKKNNQPCHSKHSYVILT